MRSRSDEKGKIPTSKKFPARRVAMIGMFVAIALICSYIESLIPINFGVPGIKLGLANLIVLFALYTGSASDAILVSILRILLAGFMFGNMFSIIYSLAGGLLSFLVMWLLKRTKKLRPISVSVAGGMSHNVGQLIVAAIVVENYNILFYIPVLLISGLVTGLVIGVVAQEVLLRLRGIIVKK
ncbi:MAG: Gx transporter family protein [Clostridiales bacterium]|nr:Gx transporter family protein [Clostridiales bacterium]